MVCGTFNDDQCTTSVLCYSLINANDETDNAIFYDELSSLIWRIPKQNILIIGEDMITQID